MKRIFNGSPNNLCGEVGVEKAKWEIFYAIMFYCHMNGNKFSLILHRALIRTGTLTFLYLRIISSDKPKCSETENMIE